MDTIITIVGPSITLLWPLVGGSLAPQIGSDFRNRTGCPTMYHPNVEVYNHSPSYILVIPLYIYVYKRPMDTISTIVGPSITITLSQPLVGGSLASGDWVRFSNRISCPTMYHLNVEVYNHSPSYILVIPLCICI